MNEFISKKMGEVMAMTVESINMLLKAESSLLCIYSKDELALFKLRYQNHKEILEKESAAAIQDVYKKKIEVTSKELQEMRDMYINKNWEEPSEVLEWMGFFHGGALVHWNILKGVGEQMTNEPLMHMSLDAIGLHESMMDNVCGYLAEAGREQTGLQK